MRRVIAVEHVSLDGVIQSPGGRDEDPSNGFALGGWLMSQGDAEVGKVITAQMNMPFDLLLGRLTYTIWAGYWPHHDNVWPNANSATKYVASNTLTAGDWQPAVILHDNVAEQVAELKQSSGPDLHVYGSGVLLQTLFAHDLVDALWLKIYPVTLGSGKRLFAHGAIPATFRVSEGKVSPGGTILVNYERDSANTL